MANAEILVHGHRGARSVRPENTLPAFDYAIEAGVDVIELDVAVTKDGVPVVSHDPVLPEGLCQGPGGTRVIREMSLAELRKWDCGSLPNPAFPRQQLAPGARVPTLDEVLALRDRGEFWFNIETKLSADHPEFTPPPTEFARLVVDTIRKHSLETRVIVQSFDFRTLHAVQKLAPEIALAALYGNGQREFTDVANEAGASIIAPNWKLVTPVNVEKAHQAGLQVVPWTANEPAEWDKLINAGVDAIITDDPAGLIQHLQRRGLR
jgi:glycerophosphoryl diester phosphodiesterase